MASPLTNIPHSFSETEKDLLLKEFTNSTKLYSSKNYTFTKGWNKATTPKDGIDLAKTFKNNTKVKFVITYESVGDYWAMYSPKNSYPKGKGLFLKYLEPYTTFFVLANEALSVEVKNKSINDSCKKLMKDTNFDFFIDSGKNQKPTMSRDNSISLASRYHSHHEKGIYDDTRVIVIYPKIPTKTKVTYRYGQASPKIQLQFAKEYENQKFYTYDFKKEKCQRGIFPSKKVPPFPILQEVK